MKNQKRIKQERKNRYYSNRQNELKTRHEYYKTHKNQEIKANSKRQKEKYHNDDKWKSNLLQKQNNRYNTIEKEKKELLLENNRKRWHKNYQSKYKITHEKWYEEEHKKTKENVMKLCGNGKAQCISCGLSNIDILTIDHKNGRQGLARKTKDINRSHYGFPFWRKILNGKLNYREFQTLCMNCNWLKHLKGLKEKKAIGRK